MVLIIHTIWYNIYLCHNTRTGLDRKRGITHPYQIHEILAVFLVDPFPVFMGTVSIIRKDSAENHLRKRGKPSFPEHGSGPWGL